MAKDSENKVLRRVLITRFSALGDVAMTIPIVYPVCEANPKVNFVLVTRKMAEGMFINRPANLIVLGIDLDQYKGISGPMKLALNLQHRYNFDAVADGDDNLPSAKRIFGDQFDAFWEFNSNQEKREDIRRRITADYVKKYNLKATMLQDFGWPAVELPK